MYNQGGTSQNFYGTQAAGWSTDSITTSAVSLDLLELQAQIATFDLLLLHCYYYVGRIYSVPVLSLLLQVASLGEHQRACNEHVFALR